VPFLTFRDLTIRPEFVAGMLKAWRVSHELLELFVLEGLRSKYFLGGGERQNVSARLTESIRRTGPVLSFLENLATRPSL
jgi:hypothetical protein